jgi:hypothetical protein
LRRRTERDSPRARPLMNRSDFEARLKALLVDRSTANANVGCLACERCERSTRSTFCADCKEVTRCHYCRSCRDCIECSHCERAVGCLSCSHCIDCERCASSAYLVRSTACTGCTYLFGCVGLHGKDFHILNEPYDRETYFSLVASLSRELGR